MTDQPNILFVMTDQQRFDTIAALGNATVYTPNLDRLVARGVAFENAYSTCPVCVPARYTIRSGCEPTRTDIYDNQVPAGGHRAIRDRCGPWLAETLGGLGYRTWGVGKFHTIPWDADEGFEKQWRSEELYADPQQRAGDSYASWIATQHPEFAWIEQLMGERTDMYNIPQLSPLPADLTVESWAADTAVEEIGRDIDPRPWFGFVSFIGPHPPLAPPVPFNRMYDPDRMPDPVVGDIAVDHMDQQIPYMNHLVFSEDIANPLARQLKARYYGEISYIDGCIGRILDAVEDRDDADNTLIVFYADHGEHLGDHHGWQKESFFEAATRVPFLVSWPGRIAAGQRRDELVCLTDLFALATGAAASPETRDGVDLLGVVDGTAAPRETLYGCWGRPGSRAFKLMVRNGDWKLIWMANGGLVQLFDLADDPDERHQRADDHPELVSRLVQMASRHLQEQNIAAALTDDGELCALPYQEWPRRRIYQFDASRGVTGFPERPSDVLEASSGR